MAPVELYSAPSVVPAMIFGAHGFWAAWLSMIVGSTIYESYHALPPSSATRHRQPLRRSYVQIFSVLAVGSLALAAYYGKEFIELSYGVWATERGIELPQRKSTHSSILTLIKTVFRDRELSVFGDRGAFRGGEHPGRMHLVRWLNDTPFYRDTLEIVAEKARYFWWGQQINLALVSWSMYLAIEGRRRKIPHLWCFLALAQLVNLSYAQNLFFITVLLTPVPLPDNVGDFVRGPPVITRGLFSKLVPAKPSEFLPRPAFYVVLLLSSFTAIFLIPFASNTPSFMTISLLARVLPFSFLVLPFVIPVSWGTIHTDPHSSHYTYTTLFRTIATVSTLLHIKSTALALFFNMPESHYYRHSLLHPFKEEYRSTFVRGYTAINRLLGAIREHPAVATVGWDAILSGLSLGLWTAIRGLDGREILGSSTAFLKRTEKEVEGLLSDSKDRVMKAIQEAEAAPSTRRRGRFRKTEDISEAKDTIVVAAPKRRGRPPKNVSTTDDDVTDTSYQPSENGQMIEGDEEADIDWEASALSWGLMSVSGLATGSAGIFGAEVMAR